jgi:hypothetical protein
MPLNALHANHIGAVGGGFELQRANNALLYIVNLDGNANNLVTLSLASFPLPKESNGIIEVPFLNEKRKFAGLTTYDDLAIVLNDYVDKETARLLYQWRYLVKDPVTGKIGNKAQYAKTGRMVKYGPDGQSDREYELQGIWPSALDGGEIDFSSEDGVKLNMTLTIDKAIYVPSVSATSAPSVL